MRDILAEVFTSMKSNKMRIALTGFSIGWGIFILIVLLGAGNGLLKGMMANFSDSTDNIFTLSAGQTSLRFNGWPENRKITFEPGDTAMIAQSFPQQVEQISCAVSDTTHVSFGSISTTATIEGHGLGFERTEHIKVLKGRTFNRTDVDSVRKVCMLSTSIADVLFRDGQEPIGQTVNIGSVTFLVTGVYAPSMDVGGTVRTIYAPFPTVQKTFCTDNHLSKISIITRGLDNISSNEAFEKALLRKIASAKEFNAADPSAVKLSADFENYLSTINILNGIYLFIIIIGLATLVSGVVGVSNIMLITVKERTRELGVRKAMGASNEHIVSLVLIESVIITLIFGYVGMLVGVGLTQLLASALSALGGSDIFASPTVGLGVIFGANMVMIFAGLIAGYVPAKKAVNCKLVDALAA